MSEKKDWARRETYEQVNGLNLKLDVSHAAVDTDIAALADD
jgi:hypothetical protein